MAMTKGAVRIYRPAKTAMQSGQAKTQRWVVEFEPTIAKSVEPLMGWTSSSDMNQQVRLTFDSRDEAIAYADRHGLLYRVIEPKERKRRQVAYSDNFKYNRVDGNWTH